MFRKKMCLNLRVVVCQGLTKFIYLKRKKSWMGNFIYSRSIDKKEKACYSYMYAYLNLFLSCFICTTMQNVQPIYSFGYNL